MCANQSVIRKVESSEELPSSKTRRNSQPSSNTWIECGMPAGKFHRSPTPTSSRKLRPSWSTALMRARSLSTYARSASLCQTHIHARQRSRDRQLSRRHLQRPASLLELIVRKGERKFQVGGGVPESVLGGVRISGFCRSSSTLRGPGSLPPTLPLMGSGLEVFDVILKHCFQGRATCRSSIRSPNFDP